MGYNGTIELIAGVKPANNGNFPMVNAKDVYVDDDTRLDAKLNGLDDSIDDLNTAVVTDATLSQTGKPADAKAVGDAINNITIEVDATLSQSGKAADAKATGDAVADLKESLDNKYDRYAVEDVAGLSLEMFDICPSQYTIVQYDNTDAIQHGSLAGTGLSCIWSKLKSNYKDITFKAHYGMFTATPSVRIAIAANANNAIGISINATSGNVNLITSSGATPLSGIIRNTNCRSIVADDTLHLVQDGTKVAIYLVDNGIDVPIFASEWVDVIETYPNAGFVADDVGFGLATNNSARNEALIYNFSYSSTSGDHFMPYDEVDERLTALENGYIAPNTVDLIIFMGQSNMAGRGTGSQAPALIEGAGYEFRAISDPTKLYPITEPFGVDENVQGAIYDYLGGYKAKTGDLVPAFANAYYKYTNCPVVGVSASEGGTRIALWQPNTDRYNDAVSRFNNAITWLTQNGYTIRHKYMIWCQGESDGDAGMNISDYKSAFDSLASAWFANGIEKIFIIKIGKYNGGGAQTYEDIMTAQNQIAQEKENIIMISTDFAGMKDRGLMKDDCHYYQAAYNEVGNYSGINMAIYVNTEKEPTMYDTQNGTLYYTHKN